MMVQIRLRGKRVGQIDENVLEEYGKYVPFNNLTMMIQNLVSKEILKRPLKSVDDVILATQYVQNLTYKSIGEYLSAYMRQYVRDQLAICENCSLYDADAMSPKGCCTKGQSNCEINGFSAACDGFRLKNPPKRGVIDLSSIYID